MFVDILKVGAVSCLSPLQTVLTVLIFTKILAGYGTEILAGYGMGSRLEFLLTPIAFAFGVASVPMVGMAMGAGLVTRARQVAWTAGLASAITVGTIGLIVAAKPSLWISHVHERSRRHRRGVILFRLGRPGVRLLRAGRVSLFLLAGSGEGRRAGDGRHCKTGAGRRRRLVALLDGRAGVDVVCAGRRWRWRFTASARHWLFVLPVGASEGCDARSVATKPGRASDGEIQVNCQTLMVRRRAAPSRTMRPRQCHSSFETPLRGSSG